MEPTQDNFCIGIITAPHGVHGAVRVHASTDSVEDFLKYKQIRDINGTIFKIKKFRPFKDLIATIKFENINNRNQAEELRNTKLYVDKAEQPPLREEEYYVSDLIGLDVTAIDGKDL